MKNKTKTTTFRSKDSVALAWIAREFPYHEKSFAWFIGAGVIILSLIIYGLMTDGWTFSMALIIAAAAYYVSHRNPPELVTITVTDKGITIGKNRIEYPAIKYFWITYNPPVVKRLYLRLASKLATNIAIELDGVDAQDLRQALKKYIKENQTHEEPFTESLIRLLKL